MSSEDSDEVLWITGKVSYFLFYLVLSGSFSDFHYELASREQAFNKNMPELREQEVLYFLLVGPNRIFLLSLSVIHPEAPDTSLSGILLFHTQY